MTDIIECFTGYYIETGAAAVCGIVLSDGETKRPQLEVRPEGDYLNGLLDALIERILSWEGKLDDNTFHLNVHVHHKNANFKKVLDKSIKAASVARGYEGTAREHIIKHTMTRKDYHKPACYDRMVALARVLIDINKQKQRLVVTTCNDSHSLDQLAVHTLCQGEWHRILAGTGKEMIEAGLTAGATEAVQNQGAANDDQVVEDEVAIVGN